MDLSSLKTRLGIQPNEISTQPITSSQFETGTFHGIYRKNSERKLFIALVKQRILQPSIESSTSWEFLEWLTPSWAISSGYSEEEYEPVFLEFMLALHGVKNATILNKVLHTIRFIALFVPRDVQAELISWILDYNN